jgi:hypothetical protein
MTNDGLSVCIILKPSFVIFHIAENREEVLQNKVVDNFNRSSNQCVGDIGEAGSGRTGLCGEVYEEGQAVQKIFIL